jgi:hypothetical protein
MFGRISPDVGRERFFEEWPETSVKQAFYRGYSQYKVKYMGFGPVSSRNVRGTMRDADLNMRGADLNMRGADLNMRDSDLNMRIRDPRPIKCPVAHEEYQSNQVWTLDSRAYISL